MIANHRVVLTVLAVLLIVAGAVLAQLPSPAASTTPPRGLIVKFRSEAPETRRTTAGVTVLGSADADKLNQVNEKYGVREMAPLIPSAVTELPASLRNVMVVVGEGASLDGLKAEYENIPSVEYVEYDYPLSMYSGIGDDPPPQQLPKDPLFAKQWYLHNTGQLHPVVVRGPNCGDDVQTNVSGVVDADIDDNEVRNAPPSNPWSVVVAVIDCGVDFTHPDLAGKKWTNTAEIAGNALDDDNNGYVDDVSGWDFSASSTDLMLQDNDPSDYFGHGTHIAGIIGAGIKNNIGISGIVPTAKILALKVFPAAFVSKVAAAIIYAGSQGADVVNMSLGMAYPSLTLESALSFARSQGSILCAAMGNSGSSMVSYPAFYSSVIAVAATNDSDKAAWFTSYGDHVDVSAPGTNILSLRAAGTDMYGDTSVTSCPEPNVHIYSTSYYLSDGTSMACPVAAGVVAYMRAISPGLSPDAAQQILQQTANDILYPRDPYSADVGWDQYTGFGRVNVNGALQATTRMEAAIVSPRPYQLLSGVVTLTGAAEGTGFTSYTLEYGVGTDPTSWTNIATSTTPVSPVNTLGTWNTTGLVGTYTIRIRVGSNNYDRVIVHVVPSTRADIVQPASAQQISFSTTIEGDAYCPGFQRFEIDYRQASGSTWQSIAVATTPVFGGELATWIVQSIEAGEYVVRLRVYNSSSVVATDSVNVIVFHSSGDFTASLPDRPTMMAAALDVDHDGINEILIGTKTGLSAFNPDGSPKTLTPTPPAGHWFVSASQGDVDGDGQTDFVGAVQKPNGLSIWGILSDGGASFEIPLDSFCSISPSTGSYRSAYGERPILIVKDADNDGIDEMIFRSGEHGIYQFSLGNPAPERSWNWGVDVVIDDLDNDGIAETYVWNSHYVYGYNDWTHVACYISRYDQNGLETDSVDISDNGVLVDAQEMSTADVNGDGQRELIAIGGVIGQNSILFAFTSDLSAVSTFPRQLPLERFMLPSMPVFGDIDSDGEPEYVITCMEGVQSSKVYAWHVDGSPVISGNADGLYITPSRVCWLGAPLLADITGDGRVDIVASSIPLQPGDYPYQMLWAWTGEGEEIEDFPIQYSTGSLFSYGMFEPVIGDADHDGQIDLLLPIYNSLLLFKEFSGVNFEPCRAPATSWRYHSNFDAVGPSNPDTCAPVSDTCGDCNADGHVDSLDVDFLADYLIGAGPAPVPYGVGDVNGSGLIDLTDLSWLVSYVETGLPLLQCSGLNFAGSNGSSPLELSLSTKSVDSYERISLTTASDIQLVTVTCGGISDAGEIKALGNGNQVRFGHRGDTVVVLIRGEGVSPVCRKGTTELVDLPTGAVTYEVSAVDLTGRITTVRVGAVSESLPKQFALSANYPNPFNPSTTINFDVPKACDYTLVIYNTLGQQVTAFSGKAEPGTVSLEWDGSRQASGVYFYRLTAGDFSATRKMMLLK